MLRTMQILPGNRRRKNIWLVPFLHPAWMKKVQAGKSSPELLRDTVPSEQRHGSGCILLQHNTSLGIELNTWKSNSRHSRKAWFRFFFCSDSWKARFLPISANKILFECHLLTSQFHFLPCNYKSYSYFLQADSFITILIISFIQKRSGLPELNPKKEFPEKRITPATKENIRLIFAWKYAYFVLYC